MIDTLNKIEEIATDMRDTTSINDSRYNDAQQIIDLCRDGLDHFIDDGK